LSDAIEYCPQCGSDLECFGLLENLENAGYAQKGVFVSSGAKWFMLISLSVLVAMSGYLHIRVDRLTVRLTEIESVSRHRESNPEIVQYVTTMGQQIENGEKEDFQKRIDDLEQRRTVAWRRLKAALAAYSASMHPPSGP